MTPYYDEAGIRIYHGDALETMAALGRGLADIVVTSPPYNMGLVPGGNGRGMYAPGANAKGGRFRDGYDGSGDDAMPYEDYCAWQRDALTMMFEAGRAAVFYNHRPRVEHGNLRMPLAGDFGDYAAHDMQLRQIIVWDRGTGIDVNLRQFCTRQEWIVLFARPAFRLVNHAASGLGDVWRLGVETGVPGHPAPFPVALPARCIATSGARSVLDPFMGSGSTLRAAKDAGVEAIGIDNKERYCELAATRLAQGSLFATERAEVESTHAL